MELHFEWLALPVLAALALPIGALVATNPAQAGMPPSPDPDPALPIEDIDAQVVFVRQNCIVDGVEMKNCVDPAEVTPTWSGPMDFLSNPTDGWIWSTRNPTASAPLLVDIGPGTFGAFTCPSGSNGFVSLHGAGREASIIRGDPAVEVFSCESLEFINLGVHSDGIYGVRWRTPVGSLDAGGSSVWVSTDLVNNVDVAQRPYATAWWEDACAESTSVHYFHASRVRAAGSAANVAPFLAECGETWFFGGEILAQLGSNGLPVAGEVNISSSFLDGSADFRAFGTAIRAGVRDEVPFSQMRGVLMLGSGAFHSHGSIISISGEGAAAPSGVVFGVQSTGTGVVHTPGTAFVVKQGAAGASFRLYAPDPSKILSPFLWQSGPTPPQSTTESTAVLSLDGKDIWVETDCDSTGDCSPAANGDEPHLMIYAEGKCGASNPWFDAVTRACRQ